MSERTDALRLLEASVLGAILCRPEMLVDMPTLEVADFLDARHRRVFTAIRNLEATSQPVDAVTVQAEYARGCDSEDQASDWALIGNLTMSYPTVDNLVDYARQIRSASLSRRVRAALVDALSHATELELDGEELLSMGLAALSCIDDVVADDVKTISALVRSRLRQLEQIAAERVTGQRTMTGYPTGISRLDERIGGWQAGIVSIVAARPGAGKSSLGLATAEASTAAGFGVHVFSLEDTEESYADRTMSRTSGVSAERMRNADLTVGDCSEISSMQTRLRGRRWLIDGRSGITADEIVRSVRRQKKANDTRVVIVDYVQLVSRVNPRQTTHEALTEIVTTLADAAKHDRIAYVVMSQLNRGVEQRTDKRPQLSDLRESGSLEERAKCVVGIYRGSLYGDPVKGIDWEHGWEGHDYAPSTDEHEQQAQIFVLKNSNGRLGRVWAHWHGPTTRMS